MAATILDGNKIASEIRAEAAAAVKSMSAAGLRPGLAVVLAGNNPESLIIEAVQALGQVGGDIVADDLLGHWKQFAPAARAAAAEVLASRRRWLPRRQSWQTKYRPRLARARAGPPAPAPAHPSCRRRYHRPVSR